MPRVCPSVRPFARPTVRVLRASPWAWWRCQTPSRPCSSDTRGERTNAGTLCGFVVLSLGEVGRSMSMVRDQSEQRIRRSRSGGGLASCSSVPQLSWCFRLLGRRTALAFHVRARAFASNRFHNILQAHIAFLCSLPLFFVSFKLARYLCH